MKLNCPEKKVCYRNGFYKALKTSKQIQPIKEATKLNTTEQDFTDLKVTIVSFKKKKKKVKAGLLEFNSRSK